MQQLPEADYQDIDKWLGIKNLLLTEAGNLRSANGVNKKLGFPAEAKIEKHSQRLVKFEFFLVLCI